MNAHPAADIFPMMSSAELQALAADIKLRGLIHPIVTYDGMILDGRNRDAACFYADVKPRFVEWSGRGSAVQYVISANGTRRHLTEDQKNAVALKALPLLEAEAEERRLAGLKKGSKKSPLPPSGGHGTAAAAAGAVAGLSERQVERLQAIRDRGAPELVDAVATSQVTLNDAASILHLPMAEQAKLVGELKKRRADGEDTAKLRTTKKRADAAELRAKPLPMPDGKFSVISADPPWAFDLREEDASHRGRTSYAQMSLEEICALAPEVAKRSEASCLLLLWAPNAYVADGAAAQVVKAWGFAGKTVLTWGKRRAIEDEIEDLAKKLADTGISAQQLGLVLQAARPHIIGRPQIGLGHYLRNSTEQVIIAVRGSFSVPDLKAQDTLLLAPRREHSRKPDEFFALVEQVFPGPKLELFSREPRAGWAQWGSEPEKFTPEIPGLLEAAP